MKITGKGFGDRVLATMCMQHPKSVLRWTQSDQVGLGPHLSVLLLVEAQPGGVEWAKEPEKLEAWARARRAAIKPASKKPAAKRPRKEAPT